MTRYIKLIRLFWGASFAAEAEYRINFILAFLSSLINLAGSMFGLFLFYRTGYAPGGWSWEAALLVLGIYTIVDGVSGTFLVPNLSQIVTQIQSGTMDFILLKPVDSQFWLSTRNFSLWGLPNLLFGFVMVGYAGCRLHLGWTAYLAGLVPFSLALVILYSLWFALGTLSVWFVKIFNITYVLKSMLEAGRYPLDAYPAMFRFFFTFVIPVAFLTTVPARAIIGHFQPGWWAGAAAAAVLLFLFSRLFWKFALRFYTSASS